MVGASKLRSRNLNGIFEAEHLISKSPVLHYTIEHRDLVQDLSVRTDSVLVLAIAKDDSSWGVNGTAQSFLALIASLQYPRHKLSIGLLVSDPKEYHRVTEYLSLHFADYGFAHVSVLCRNDKSMQMSRGNRKADDKQKQRRRLLARYRNFLLFSCLKDWHQGVLWVDSDIVKMPGYLLRKMIDCESNTLLLRRQCI